MSSFLARRGALAEVDTAMRQARLTLYGASGGIVSAGELEHERRARAELELAPAPLTEGVDRGELERELAAYLSFWDIAGDVDAESLERERRTAAWYAADCPPIESEGV